jgi:ABC-type thiamine transport system substrate-binding protein
MGLQCDQTFANDYLPASYRSSHRSSVFEAAANTHFFAFPTDQTEAHSPSRLKTLRERWPYAVIGISAVTTLVWITLLIWFTVSYATELVTTAWPHLAGLQQAVHPSPSSKVWHAQSKGRLVGLYQPSRRDLVPD